MCLNFDIDNKSNFEKKFNIHKGFHCSTSDKKENYASYSFENFTMR